MVANWSTVALLAKSADVFDTDLLTSDCAKRVESEWSPFGRRASQPPAMPAPTMTELAYATLCLRSGLQPFLFSSLLSLSLCTRLLTLNNELEQRPFLLEARRFTNYFAYQVPPSFPIHSIPFGLPCAVFFLYWHLNPIPPTPPLLSLLIICFWKILHQLLLGRDTVRFISNCTGIPIWVAAAARHSIGSLHWRGNKEEECWMLRKSRHAKTWLYLSSFSIRAYRAQSKIPTDAYEKSEITSNKKNREKKRKKRQQKIIITLKFWLTMKF